MLKLSSCLMTVSVMGDLPHGAVCWFAIVVFPDHTHLLFGGCEKFLIKPFSNWIGWGIAAWGIASPYHWMRIII